MSRYEFAAGDEMTSAKLNKNIIAGSYNAGETIEGATLPVACYQNATDNEFYACDGNDQAKLDFIGFAITDSTDGNPIDIQFNGIVKGFTGLVEGTRYYIQDDKTIGTTIGTYETQVGIAISETELFIQKGSWEYLGSVSIAKNSSSTVLSVARFFLIKGTTAVSGMVHAAEGIFTLTRTGLTSSSLSLICENSVGDDYGVKISASLSGNTITISGQQTNSSPCTVYMYK